VPLRADWLALFETEADLESDMEVGDLAVYDLTTDLGDLEPVQVPQSLTGAAQCVPDGRLDAIRRGGPFIDG
jgi:hypothetical protein